jgi:CBS domain containing-hemolysin-like protein
MLVNRLLRRRDESAQLRESLEEVIEQSEAEDRPLAREERSMMLNILQFGELTVADIMVPRADIIGVEASTTLDALARIFRDAQHSRLPVYRESLDHPVGMVHIKDLIGLAVPESEGVPHPKTIQDIRRDVLFVPPSMPAREDAVHPCSSGARDRRIWWNGRACFNRGHRRADRWRH